MIDIHSHIYPKVYLDILDSCGQLLQDPNTGVRYIAETGKDSGHKIRLFETMWDMPSRLKVMDKLGIDIEVLSIGNPWISYVPSGESKVAARRLNRELASIVRENPNRFAAMGVLPVTSPSDAVEEVDYGIDELGLRGYMIGTHVFGKSISSAEFLPIFYQAARREVPIYIHPLARPDVADFYDRLTVTGLIFPTETSIAATSIMLSGLFDKFPNAKIILAHLGGMIPFSVGRLERAVETNPISIELKSRARDYLMRFYMDSIAYYSPTIRYAAGLWGASKIMLGTDYPYAWGDNYERVIGSIKECELEENEKNLMLGQNAAKLFKL